MKALIEAILLVLIVTAPLLALLFSVWFSWWTWKKGRRLRIGALVLLCVTCGMLLRGYWHDRGVQERDEARRSSIEHDLKTDLAIGDSREKIEEVLRKRNLHGTYDAALGGYAFSERAEGPDTHLTVRISINRTTGRLQAIEVKLSYIFL